MLDPQPHSKIKLSNIQTNKQIISDILNQKYKYILSLAITEYFQKSTVEDHIKYQ